MPGKDPHRPQGKTSDAEHMQPIATSKDAPFRSPSAKEVAEHDRLSKEARGGQSSFSAEEQIGGSRPGVESRVKGAIESGTGEARYPAGPLRGTEGLRPDAEDGPEDRSE